MGFFSNIFSKIFPSANAAEVVVAAPPAPAAAGAPAAPPSTGIHRAGRRGAHPGRHARRQRAELAHLHR